MAQLYFHDDGKTTRFYLCGVFLESVANSRLVHDKCPMSILAAIRRFRPDFNDIRVVLAMYNSRQEIAYEVRMIDLNGIGRHVGFYKSQPEGETIARSLVPWQMAIHSYVVSLANGTQVFWVYSKKFPAPEGPATVYIGSQVHGRYQVAYAEQIVKNLNSASIHPGEYYILVARAGSQ